MADRKDKFALISYFVQVYKKSYKQPVVVNRYAAQWDADALIDSFGLQECKGIVDYYIHYAVAPSWRGFAKNAERVYNKIQEEAADKEARRIMRERVKEWAND